MDNHFKFLVNNKIQIEMEDGYYKSTIQDIGEDFIAINIPVNEGKFLPLMINEKVKALYYFNKDIYAFDTIVIGRKIEKIYMIILAKPSFVKMVQRRNFVRVQTFFEILCAKVKEDDQSKLNVEEYEFFKGDCLDLSGGGMKVSLNQEVKLKDRMLITIELKNESITLKGIVVRVFKEEIGKTVCGINFVEVDDVYREKVIKHVFEIMREQRIRGSKEV